jgi:hypothetical protein
MKGDFMREKIFRSQEKAAEYVDYDVKTIRRKVKAGELHPRPDGGFNKSDLEPFKRANEQKRDLSYDRRHDIAFLTLKGLSAKTGIDFVILRILKRKGLFSRRENGYYYAADAKSAYNHYKAQQSQNASDGTTTQAS